MKFSHLFSALLFTIFAFSLVSCSTDSMMEVKKEESFYKLFQNPAGELATAEKNIETINLLSTNEDFPIRLALFDNGKFYYQVDKLGKGEGTWVYEKGGLRLNTKRKIFSMSFYISAASEIGEKLVVKFFDSKGHNEYPLEFRDVKADPNLGKLREFKNSAKDI